MDGIQCSFCLDLCTLSLSLAFEKKPTTNPLLRSIESVSELKFLAMPYRYERCVWKEEQYFFFVFVCLILLFLALRLLSSKLLPTHLSLSLSLSVSLSKHRLADENRTGRSSMNTREKKLQKHFWTRRLTCTRTCACRRRRHRWYTIVNW